MIFQYESALASKKKKKNFQDAKGIKESEVT